MTLRMAVVLGLGILVGGAASVAAAETHVVTVSDSGFDPATLTVKKGDTVQWVWEEGSGSHEILDGNAEDSEETWGKNFDFILADTPTSHSHSITFEKIETYPYFSKSKPSLNGTITVTGATPVDRKTWGWLKTVYQGA